jgi:hypothetical protein
MYGANSHRSVPTEVVEQFTGGADLLSFVPIARKDRNQSRCDNAVNCALAMNSSPRLNRAGSLRIGPTAMRMGIYRPNGCR